MVRTGGDITCRRDDGVSLGSLLDKSTGLSRLITPQVRDLVAKLTQLDSWLNPVELYEPSNLNSERDRFLLAWYRHLKNSNASQGLVPTLPHLRYQHLVPYFYPSYRDWWSQLTPYPAGSAQDIADRELFAQMDRPEVTARFAGCFARRRESERFLATAIPQVLNLAQDFRAHRSDYIQALSPEEQIEYASYALLLQTMRDDQLTLEMIRCIVDSDLIAEQLWRQKATLPGGQQRLTTLDRDQIAADRATGLIMQRKYGRLNERLERLAWDMYEEKRKSLGLTRPLDLKTLRPARLEQLDASVRLELPAESDLEVTSELSRDQIAWLEEKVVSADELRDAFVTVLRWYDLYYPERHDARRPGFQVAVTPQVSSIDVRDKTESGIPTIFIPARYNNPAHHRSRADLLLLIGHEIECHARQSANGQVLFGFGGGPLKIDQEDYYEGLAMQADRDFRRRYLGIAAPTPGPYYVIAIGLAQEGHTFTAVFERLYQLLIHQTAHPDPIRASERAWRVAYRVFRGSTRGDSTDSHYAMTKDQDYLAGYLCTRALERDECRDYNQLAITSGDFTRLLGNYRLEPGQIPYPYQDARDRYWREVLKPQYEQETAG